MKSTKFICLPTLTIFLVIFGLSGQAQGLQLTPGIHWVVDGPSQLVLHNASLINNGNFIADSSTVVFTSDTGAAGAFVGGANPVSFYHLTLGQSSNDLQLNNNAFVTGRITLDSGNLQLNGYLLDLGSSGSIIGERNEARIIGDRGGAIRITSLLTSPQSVNPGNIGVEITSQAYLGSTVITRGHSQLTNSSGETGIQRWFDIAPETNTSLHASLRFLYLDGELVGKDKNALTLFSGEEMNNTMTPLGKDAAEPAANWILKSNIDQLHRFTLAVGPSEALSKIGRTITSMQIYPTPSHNTFTLQIVSKENGTGLVYLYDQSGHILEEKREFWQAGVTRFNWNISRYAAGTYYLSIGSSDGSALIVVKQ
jgi:hypothetical protein